MTPEDLDKEFDKFWNGAYSKDWPGSRVYAYVDKGTARALFLEGWVRHEVWAFAKEEAEKYVKEKKETHE